MTKNPIPKTYINKKGEVVDIPTGRILNLNKDGSIDMRQYNDGVAGRRPRQLEKNFGKANKRKEELSVYIGLDSEENWNKYFDYLKKHPTEVVKAAVSAGFTRQGVSRHINKNNLLKERYEDIMEEELDNLETNVHDMAYADWKDEPKIMNPALRANETLLNAHAKERGYGHRSGLNIEGGNIQINIINDTGSVMPGELKEKTEDVDFEEVKES